MLGCRCGELILHGNREPRRNYGGRDADEDVSNYGKAAGAGAYPGC